MKKIVWWMLICAVVWSSIEAYHSLKGRDAYIVADSFTDPRIKPFRRWMKDLIPRDATMIRAEVHSAAFCMSTEIRCHVKPESMRRFIAEHPEWKFRFDSTLTNDDAEAVNYPLDRPQFWGVVFKDDSRYLRLVPSLALSRELLELPIRESRPEFSDTFWSYNNVHLNGGGERLYYDVERETYYYDWSSN